MSVVLVEEFTYGRSFDAMIGKPRFKCKRSFVRRIMNPFVSRKETRMRSISD